jgi:hypothetical protein
MNLADVAARNTKPASEFSIGGLALKRAYLGHLLRRQFMPDPSMGHPIVAVSVGLVLDPRFPREVSWIDAALMSATAGMSRFVPWRAGAVHQLAHEPMREVWLSLESEIAVAVSVAG